MDLYLFVKNVDLKINLTFYIKMGMRINCNQCNIEYSRKDLKRINGNWLCKDCYKKRKEERREYLKREILGIRKREDLEKEWRERKKQNPKPIIRGAKEIKISCNLHNYLTKEEKQFLFRKYLNKGLPEEEADKKIREDARFLQNLVEEMKQKKKSEEEINRIFKEEFAKLISKC